MRKYILFIISILHFGCYADEGMWIPMLLQQLNEQEMRSMGLRLTAEDIYSINKSSLKDAVVLFGGGCTAEIVSDQGLILTNHHCGISFVQSHSSLEHDYLANGFWAKNKPDELPCPGLSVTLLIRMEEVTEKVLNGVNDQMNEKKRDSICSANIKQIEKEAVKATHYEAKVKAFYYGNVFYLFVTEVFKDIRLAGAPPANIGQFGGDTDNWMWPRHTGDFSVFRIYTDKEGKPAEYSKENIPYKPKFHFQISMKGYQEGDFTFVYGYPGTTQEYITSYAVELISQVENPIRITLRDIRLTAMDKYMNESRLTRLEYTAKSASIANGWKKWQGEDKGLKRLRVIQKKKEQEALFQQWVDKDAGRKARYGTLLAEMEKTISEYKVYDKAIIYYNEVGNGIEILRFARQFNTLINISREKNSKKEDVGKVVVQMRKSAQGFFKNYYPAIDREILPRLLREYVINTEDFYLPQYLKAYDISSTGHYEAINDQIFSRSFLVSESRVMHFLDKYKKKNFKKIQKDPAFKLAMDMSDIIAMKVTDKLAEYRKKIDSLQRIYMKAQIEMAAGKRMYPDANLSLRLTYGKVKSYNSVDAIHYQYFTTIDGIMEKEDTTIYDMVVDPRLKELFRKKDYGPYADTDGKVHTCFITSNHTTGGNSGSPVLNADGQLIGINFDRCWEGTMSDIQYDPEQCRNISLDIRYCLFVIDKVCGARSLVEEMIPSTPDP